MHATIIILSPSSPPTVGLCDFEFKVDLLQFDPS